VALHRCASAALQLQGTIKTLALLAENRSLVVIPFLLCSVLTTTTLSNPTLNKKMI
jgi:hypothetical protein